jgi:hypothetical protein
MYSNRISETHNLVSTIQAKNGTGSYYGDAISLDSTIGRRFVAYVNEGTIGSSGTVDFEFQWSATSGGTYATITGAKMVQDLTGGKTFQVEIATEAIIQLFPTAKWMKPYLKTLVAATPTSVIVVATEMAYVPCPQSAANAGAVVAVP